MTIVALKGLSKDEAARLLASVGPNSLKTRLGRGLGQIVLETLREPMFLLLIGATLLYLTLGDMAEGLFLLAGACATIGLVVMQEARSEGALAALRDLTEPFARVIRDGAESQIPVSQLVPGDIVLVGEGQRLPADAVQMSGEVLSVDESALTGESAPVAKRPLDKGEAVVTDAPPGAEAGPYLFAGTLIVRGQAVLKVLSTGPRTALGRIGVSLATLPTEMTPLQKTAGRLVTVLGLFAIGFCLMVTAAYGLLRHDWFAGALAGVTVAISLIPEEFPMILAVFLALGAWRMATHKVLVRRSAAIEALGSVTALCVDKTGTLTRNQMQLARVWTTGGDDPVGADRATSPMDAALIRSAALASAVIPLDPMDKAIRSLCATLEPQSDLKSGEPERTWPLRPELLAVIQSWGSSDGRHNAAAKGAPEAIFRLCRLAEADAQPLHQQVELYARQGLRVLGVATARLKDLGDEAPGAADFALQGLLAFQDPLRDDVVQALTEAKAAGIFVFMMTGDHPATAMTIANEAGIDTASGVIVGTELASLSVQALAEKLAHARVFARVVPDQKLQIVQALKARGDVVAMTGDGVNDAPALKAADIGIAMGLKGTDVAREAAAMVLVDDSFSSIIGGVRMGRRIFANLRKALIYVTAIHIPIAGLALAPILMGLPPMLLPLHVVLLELAIDPICAMVFEVEPGDAGAMQQPPRRVGEALFGPPQLALALVQGTVVLAGVLGVYVWALAHFAVNEARGATFITLVVANLALALTDAVSVGSRLFAPHRWVYLVIAGGACALLAIVLGVPTLARLFLMAPPHLDLLVVSITVACVSGGWFSVARRASVLWARPPG
jgi:Ca2+-transporting ATPase